MSSFNRWFKRTLVYGIGLLILAFGVSLSVRSDLGVSPVNAVPYVVSLITGIEFGVCVTVFLCSCILVQVVILRRNFKLTQILQIICSTLLGLFVGITNNFVQHYIPAPSNYLISLLMLAVSILFVAIGVTTYLQADVILLPSEGVMKAVSQTFSIKFPTAKIGFDCTVVLVAIALSFLCLHKLDGVREGTVVAAIGVGLVMKALDKPYRQRLEKFLS